ncbi:MAG: shikimate dehydrogenase [Candidatus Firestonebacteria bacterium]|nr:shikimate dehydrogenase [Candidatus Firestonebacteria bacterium]
MQKYINLLGIFGYPVSHSLSPYMHNKICKELNLPYFYVPFEILPENLGFAVKSIRILGIKGINITIPYKEKVMQYLDKISKEAKLIGAVNTIINDSGKLIGYNTDGKGFIKAFEKNFKTTPSCKTFLILGAGGAAKAIITQLCLEGAKKIFIANRTLSNAKNIVLNIKKNIPYSEIYALDLNSNEINNIISEIDVLVNTTSIGMKKTDALLINNELLSNKTIVIDIIYNPRETLLLKEAKKKGAKTLNGIDMLVFQGALAFEIWTGVKPPIEVMRKTLIEHMFNTIEKR